MGVLARPAILGVVLVGILILSGSLGSPFLRDEVPFSAIKREHFSALAVSKQRAAPEPDTLLIVRVNTMGDGADADLSEPLRWLESRAGILVVRDPQGVPLYLTRGDLAATSGRATLGATLPSGMAIEVGDERVAPCVVAHEILHFVGLRHVDDKNNIMSPHCRKNHLDVAVLEDWQLAHIQGLGRIEATTAAGYRVWAHRG